jgi:hypothetical protein
LFFVTKSAVQRRSSLGKLAISGTMMHLCRTLTGDHKWPVRTEFRWFVLNVPLSSVISR